MPTTPYPFSTPSGLVWQMANTIALNRYLLALFAERVLPEMRLIDWIRFSPLKHDLAPLAVNINLTLKQKHKEDTLIRNALNNPRLAKKRRIYVYFDEDGAMQSACVMPGCSKERVIEEVLSRSTVFQQISPSTEKIAKLICEPLAHQLIGFRERVPEFKRQVSFIRHFIEIVK